MQFLFPSHGNRFYFLIQYFLAEMHGVSDGSLNIIFGYAQFGTAFGFINEHIVALQSCKFHHVQSTLDIVLFLLLHKSSSTEFIQKIGDGNNLFIRVPQCSCGDTEELFLGHIVVADGISISAFIFLDSAGDSLSNLFYRNHGGTISCI